MIDLKIRHNNQLLFTNVKYHVGGGKTGKPLRVRKGQNIYINIGDEIDQYNNKEFKILLSIWSKNTIQCTKSTVVKKLYKNV